MTRKAGRAPRTVRHAAGSGEASLGQSLLAGAVAGFAKVAMQSLRRKERATGFQYWLGEIVAGAALAAGQEIRSSLNSGVRQPVVSAPTRTPGRMRPLPRRTAERRAVGSIAHERRRSSAVRKLNGGAAALSFSILADSAMEHYRGGFYNPVMYIAPAVSTLTLLSASAALRRPRRRLTRNAVFAGAAATGLIGTAFHAYNVAKREGGIGWLNLFYAAPLAAPMGITFAGLFGLAAARINSQSRREQSPGEKNVSLGPILASAAALGLVGTAAEAGVLHFRGAFQDPFMYLPVTIPPVAGAAVAAALSNPRDRRVRTARALLWSTAGLGVIGMGFHAYGIHRNMGGWRNWSQMILQGPPLPAPPSFTGMALAGLAGLELLAGGDNE
jgi:hypothetical protein